MRAGPGRWGTAPRSVLAVAVLATTLTMAAGRSADAHNKVSGTEVFHTSTNAPPLRFGGQISSANDRCFADRLIRLAFGGNVVGTDRTNSAGQYSVESDTNESGEYTITVVRRVLTRRGAHRHVCGTDSVTANF